jgi:ABC-type Fe3+ transport system permease subunit
MSDMNPPPTMISEPAFVSQMPEDMPPKNANKKKIIIIVVIALLVLCCCVLVIGVIVYAISQGGGDFNWELGLGRQLLNSIV